MNYAGHEKLRAEVAEVANAMCDLRTTMFRANRLLMEAYTEILELEACFKD